MQKQNSDDERADLERENILVIGLVLHVSFLSGLLLRIIQVDVILHDGHLEKQACR